MSTVTVTKTAASASNQGGKSNSQLKDKEKKLKEVLKQDDLDKILDKVVKLDNVCAFTKCKKKTADFAITCKFCNSRFCTTHGLPEIHGCGEAVRREEKRKFLHPEPKLTNEKHEQASTKLAMKLKQMELARKSKQGYKDKGKK